MRRGFSMVEVLFSIMILAIGFIMIAGIFPVAISQTQRTVDDAAAERVAGCAFGLIEAMVSPNVTPSTGGAVVPLAIYGPTELNGNQIDGADARYGWTAMYARLGDNQPVRAFVIVGRSRNQSVYEAGRDIQPHDPLSVYLATLDPKGVDVQFEEDGGGGRIQFVETPAENPNVGAAGAGAFVVVADSGALGESSGHVVRLLAPVAGMTQTWTLDATHDLASSNIPSGVRMRAYLLGRGYVDPWNPSKGFEGEVQDIQVFTRVLRGK